MKYDLLTTVEYGGCSAKLSPGELADALKSMPRMKHENLLVDIETHDDAGVYKLNEETALIQTTDFFSPICSDPFTFGEIAAANALSDVYAMGGEPITALNLVMFPSKKIPLEVLKEILKGGMKKVSEAGALIVGGHTIDDYPPKYGLAVTGVVHPDRVITNSLASPGEKLLLTKPIGIGIIVAGKRIEEAKEENYIAALDNMKLLNKEGGTIMQKHKIHCATDITGFSLLGHSLKMAVSSNVTFRINAQKVPLLNGVYELVDMGCIPGACFRNLNYVENDCLLGDNLDYNLKMSMLDAQTSGGLLMCVPPEKVKIVLQELRGTVYPHAEVIGEVVAKSKKVLEVI